MVRARRDLGNISTVSSTFTLREEGEKKLRSDVGPKKVQVERTSFLDYRKSTQSALSVPYYLCRIVNALPLYQKTKQPLPERCCFLAFYLMCWFSRRREFWGEDNIWKCNTPICRPQSAVTLFKNLWWSCLIHTESFIDPSIYLFILVPRCTSHLLQESWTSTPPPPQGTIP